MTKIIPVSDLRNKFPEVEAMVKNGDTVYLTKNGYGCMVLLGLEKYDELIGRSPESKSENDDQEDDQMTVPVMN